MGWTARTGKTSMCLFFPVPPFLPIPPLLPVLTLTSNRYPRRDSIKSPLSR